MFNNVIIHAWTSAYERKEKLFKKWKKLHLLYSKWITTFGIISFLFAKKNEIFSKNTVGLQINNFNKNIS